MTFIDLHNGKEMRQMLEKEIERKLVRTVQMMGGKAVKIACPGYDGMPDRMVLLKGGRMGFVEVKRPSEKPRPLQESRHRMLRELGFKVYVLDSMEKIGGIIDEIRTL